MLKERTAPRPGRPERRPDAGAGGHGPLDALGRVVWRHPWAVVLTWLVVLVVSLATAVTGLIGPSVFDRLDTGIPAVPGPAQEAQDVLLKTQPGGPVVILVVRGVTVRTSVSTAGATFTSPVAEAAFDAVRTDLLAVPGVGRVDDPFAGNAPHVLSAATAPYIADNQHGVLMVVTLRKDLPVDRQPAANDAVTRLLETVAPRIPGARGAVASQEGLFGAIQDGTQHDLEHGESIALPISLLIMVFVFGGLLAAGLPLLAALASIVAGLGGLLIFSSVITIDPITVNVVSVLGLGLCIDYGLLLISRYREEAHGRPRSERELALRRTLSTAGRTILFSGLTVTIALAGLLVFRTPILRGMGAAGISTVTVAMLAALTLIPALLRLSTYRLLEPGLPAKIPGLRRLARGFGDVAPARGVFSRLGRLVQRRPFAAIYLVVGLLVVAALPVGHLHIVTSDYELLPPSAEQRQALEWVNDDFSFAATPAVQVLAETTPDQVGDLVRGIEAQPGVTSVDPPVQWSGGGLRVTELGVRIAGAPGSPVVEDAAVRIRNLAPGVEYRVWVAGSPVITADYVHDLRHRGPVAALIIVLAALVLLFLMTGSIVLGIKALIMNVLSLGATLGILIWAFQDGALETLLHFRSTGGLESFTPPILLAFGFGLAMDYEVFLLARIAELHRAGVPNQEAVVRGLQRSGRIITSAAVIMVVVFCGLVLGQVLIVKEVALALVVAVVVDASLVRMVLVPATMTVLGDWNWWAPAPLRRWYDRFGLRGE